MEDYPNQLITYRTYHRALTHRFWVLGFSFGVGGCLVCRGFCFFFTFWLIKKYGIDWREGKHLRYDKAYILYPVHPECGKSRTSGRKNNLKMKTGRCQVAIFLPNYCLRPGLNAETQTSRNHSTNCKKGCILPLNFRNSTS